MLGGCICRSVYAQRAKIALLEKGIPHKVELIEKENKSKAFLNTGLSITSNPAKSPVPTIVGKLSIYRKSYELPTKDLAVFFLGSLSCQRTPAHTPFRFQTSQSRALSSHNPALQSFFVQMET